MYSFSAFAQLALDLATPLKDAVTPLDDDDLLGLVASTAAHEVATVDSYARVVAFPPVRAENAQLGILLAKRWGWLQVHQILGPRGFVLRIVRFQLEIVALLAVQVIPSCVHRVACRIAGYGVAHTSGPVAVAHHDSRSAVEAILEVVADHSERG